MLNTSLDFLYLTLAAAIAILTVFIGWGIYYVVRMLRNGVYTVEKFTSVLQKTDEVMDLAKEKLRSGGAYLEILVRAVQSGIKYFGAGKSDGKKRTSKKKK